MKSPKIIDNLDVGSFWRRKIGGPVFILAGKDHFAGTVKIKTITTEFRIKAETLVNLYVEVDDDDARKEIDADAIDVEHPDPEALPGRLRIFRRKGMHQLEMKRRRAAERGKAGRPKKISRNMTDYTKK
jgi:hypothetical protein